MNRKWRTNPGSLHSVAPYADFRAAIPPGDDAYELANPTDLYSVYTVLHIESKEAELRWSPQGRFYYFLARWRQALRPGEGPQRVAAPEGDEDPPPQVVPEGSLAALQAEAQKQQQQQGRKGGGKKQRQQQGAQGQQAQSAAEQATAAAGANAAPVAAAAAPAPATEPAAAAGEVAAGEAAAAAPEPAAAAAAPATRLRTQIVVPVSSAVRCLTPELLQRFFSVRGVQAQQLLLALVDSNGVVTRSCLYNYVQAPLEGPGTADLLLLDD